MLERPCFGTQFVTLKSCSSAGIFSNSDFLVFVVRESAGTIPSGFGETKAANPNL